MAMASKDQLCGVLAEHEPAAGPGKEPAEKERAFQLAGHPSPSVYCEARGKLFMPSATGHKGEGVDEKSYGDPAGLYREICKPALSDLMEGGQANNEVQEDHGKGLKLLTLYQAIKKVAKEKPEKVKR